MITHWRQPTLAAPQPAPCRVLYIGPAADELCTLLAPQIGRVDIHYESGVPGALMVARQRRFDVVVVDQRDEKLATQLVLPLLSALGYPVKLVVISRLTDVSHYLAIPGVARVLAAPVRESQLLRVLGLERRNRAEAIAEAPPAVDAHAAATPPEAKVRVPRVWDALMRLVSMLYKRAAFVLLAALFSAFLFYGVLIAFFLLSSGWAAPLTLTRGHELVSKAEGELTQVLVTINQTDQRLQETVLAKSVAKRELEDAKSLVKYALGTVKTEISTRKRQGQVLNDSSKRLRKVRDALRAQLASGGAADDLARLYKNRVIDRKTYSANTMSLLQATERLASLEGEIDTADARVTDFAVSYDMLKSLQTALETGTSVEAIPASASDLLLLAKQASDALSARSIAEQRLASLATSETTLGESLKVLRAQLAALKISPLVRALDKRIDVLFVPYGNQGRFTPGTPLYTCTLTIFWCHKAGTVGQPLPGEVNAVHPFFGKPIRGSFVEAQFDDEDAATREVIHGRRKPLFF